MPRVKHIVLDPSDADMRLVVLAEDITGASKQLWIHMWFIIYVDMAPSSVKLHWKLWWRIRVSLYLNGTFRQELVSYDVSLVVLLIISIISFHFWHILGDSVWIWIKSNLFWFIEGKTHISTSWHAKMSFTLSEPIQNVLLFRPPHYLQGCTENLSNMEGVLCNTPIPDQKLCWARGLLYCTQMRFITFDYNVNWLSGVNPKCFLKL